MLLYLVRHGESEANRGGFHHLPTTPLSAAGVRQAKVLTKRFKKIEIDFIYSSPQARARKTAEIIAREKHLPIEFWESLKEIRVPSQVWGKPLSDEKIAAIDSVWEENFATGKRFSDEETFTELSLRGESVLKHLLKKHKGQKVLCVSHSTMAKMIVAKAIFGKSLTPQMFLALRGHLWFKNTGITVCEYTDKCGWTLVTWNDAAHLG